MTSTNLSTAEIDKINYPRLLFKREYSIIGHMIEANPTPEVRTKKKISKTRTVIVGWGLTAILAGCKGGQPSPETPLPLPTIPFATQTIDMLPSSSPWDILGPAETATPEPIPSPTVAPTETPSSTVFPTPEIPVAPEPTPSPVSEVLSDVNIGLGSEPSIAVSPTDPELMAATYVQINAKCDKQIVIVSHDGGLTWDPPKTMPMKQKCSGAHPRIAFDEQNTLWMENAVFVSGGVSDGIAYSKDLGKTWTVQTRKDAKAWVGRFPDIATDTNPASPNYGLVAATYNYNKGNLGSGIRVVVSPDKGKSWKSIDIPPVEVKGYPTNWLINSQLKSLPNGDWILSYADTAMKGIGLKDPVNDWRGVYKYLVYPTVLIHYDKALNKVTAEKPVEAIRLSSGGDVEWQSEMGVDKTTGRVWMAVSSYGKKDTVYVGDSDDNGKTWKWQTVGAKDSSNFKPSLAVSDNGTVFVGFHTLDSKKTVRSYYSISYGNGVFTEPKLATQTTYGLNSVKLLNGVGLREQASAGPNGDFYWAFGIGKKGKPNVEIVTIDPDFGYKPPFSPHNRQ